MSIIVGTGKVRLVRDLTEGAFPRARRDTWAFIPTGWFWLITILAAGIASVVASLLGAPAWITALMVVAGSMAALLSSFLVVLALTPGRQRDEAGSGQEN